MKNNTMKRLAVMSALAFVLCISCTDNSQDSDDTKKVSPVVTIDTASRADAGGSGVMLQGFTWSSPDADGDWYVTMSANADAVKNTFEYVWFPPCTDSVDANGYLPRQLNMLTQAYPKNGTHSPSGSYSSFYGTEAQLKQAIADIKPSKAVADVVINHRCGTTDWGDFTNPSWGVVKGSNYSAICKDDEGFLNYSADMFGARFKGAADTGTGYASARDVDHTNETVQDGIVKWMTDTLKAEGFVGWRYDMVKGYDGVYTGYYNAETDPAFSVGEYWDGDISLITAWITRTAQYNRNVAGKTSRAFDYVLKYSLNTVFGTKQGTANSNYVQLASVSNLYKQMPGYAVTFVDNHDTGSTQATCPLDSDDIGAAYSLILTHPGYPCVAWYHYFAASDCPNDLADQYIGGNIVPGTTLTYREHIANLIKLRTDIGITDLSTVEILAATTVQYAGKVTGTNGTLITVIGSSYETPEGFTLKYSGTGYQIFVKS